MSDFNRFSKLLRTSPQSTSGGKLPSRAILSHFDTEADALTGQDCWKLSLDGQWDFNFYDAPDKAVPQGPFQNKIAVPGEWDMQGYGHPWYLNITMPFDTIPPAIPDDGNPTGVYHRTFTIPETWNQRRTVLHFDGVENFFLVLLNGQEIGYSKNSRGVSEFDITDLLLPGENDLVVIVSQYASSSFVEDQDQWWHGGIVRSVTLFSEPLEHIEDAFVQADLNENFQDGILKVEFVTALTPRPDLKRELLPGGYLLPPPALPSDGWTFDVGLFDGDRLVAQKQGKLTEQTGDQICFRQKDIHHYISSCELTIPGIHPWNAEDPYRYTVLITLRDENGTQKDLVGLKTGFRHVEVTKQALLINGKRVLLNGVNRHEHNSRTGRTVSVADMRRDLDLMKQFNINAIRTSHYPNIPVFYDLCDEYGFYVFDEANIESHAFFADLCRNPLWSTEWLTRAVDLVERDKNHPCVIVWSLGNESGFGENHAAACGWIRNRDASRPLLCERATTNITTSMSPMLNRECTDIIAPMYRPPHEIRNWAECIMVEDRPLILCEYSHAMGNSCGGLVDYFREFRTHNGLQGGFIWEWCDHGIWKKNQDGTEFLAFGGDFGEPYHDTNFVTDGLVSPDRAPHPALYELKKLGQPAEFTLISAGTKQLKLTNRRYFTGLDDCRLRWEIAINGNLAQSGTMDLPQLAPDGFIPDPSIPFGRSLYDRQLGNEAILQLPYAIPELAFGDTCTLNVQLELKEDCIWAKAGHAIAYEQFILPITPMRLPQKQPAAAIPRDIRDIFAAGKLHLWRATTDNDANRREYLLGKEKSRAVSRWINLGLEDIEGVQENGSTVYHLTEGRTITHTMTLEETDGALLCRNRIEVGPNIADLPRIGLVFTLPREFMTAEYFGLGPMENHQDRLAAATLGRFTLAADDPCPYILPQEYGNRCGVRELILHGNGRTVKIVPVLPMECSLRQYDERKMQHALHWHEVPVENVNTLSLDLYQRGVGSGSCGPDTFTPYRSLGTGIYQFDFWIK